MRVEKIKIEYDRNEKPMCISMTIEDKDGESYTIEAVRTKLEEEFTIAVSVPKRTLLMKELCELEKYAREFFRILKEKVYDELLREVVK